MADHTTPKPKEAKPSAVTAPAAEDQPRPATGAEEKAIAASVEAEQVEAAAAALAVAEPEPAPEPDPVPTSANAAIKNAIKNGVPIEVIDSFATLIKGDEVHYQKGELIHPEDPVLKRNPAAFRPVVYPHPVSRARLTLKTPDVRS